MKVLVTGASSLLMGRVVSDLVQRGDDVVCLQRRAAALPGVPADAVQQFLADVRDAAAVDAAARGCDVVIHGAARVGVTGTWDEVSSVNVGGTQNVVAASRGHGVALVHVSSPSVAHEGGALVGAGATPAVTGRRRAFYAESKAIAEQRVLAAAADLAAVTVVRPHLVWGPGDEQLVGRIVARARAGRLALVGDGSALIDSTCLANAASALVAAADRLVSGGSAAACHGRPYVVSNGEPRPVAELMERICRAAGVPFAPRRVPVRLALAAGSLLDVVWPRISSAEPPLTRFVAEQLGTAHWFDTLPARRDLGWTPSVTLDEAFVELAASYGH